MAKKKKNPKGRLLTRQEMGEAFGVRPEHFDKSYRSFVPEDLIERSGRRVLFRLGSIRAIVDGLVAQQRELARAVVDDPMLAGADSPALERYRALRAEMVERDLRERDRELLPAEHAEDLVNIVVGRVRACGEQLTLRFGNDAQAILDEALDDAEREIETKYGHTDPST